MSLLNTSHKAIQDLDNLYLYRKIAVAPMLKITNHYFRYLLRLISNSCMLYTEMVPINAILIGKKFDLLKFHPLEHPLALQLAANEPKGFSDIAQHAEQLGFDEININIGCPSLRTTSSNLGLSLLRQPQLVAKMIESAKQKITIPISIKTRIAIDDQNSDKALENFIKICASAGCKTFILHARPGITQKMSTKQNLNIPALNYQRVFNMKKIYPYLTIILNGGLDPYHIDKTILNKVDGLMFGRKLIANPYSLQQLEKSLDIPSKNVTFEEVVLEYLDYIEPQYKKPNQQILCAPLLKLFSSRPGARKIRRIISENYHKDNFIKSLKKMLLNSTQE